MVRRQRKAMNPDSTVQQPQEPVRPDGLERMDEKEVREWVESLEEVLETEGPGKAQYLLQRLLGVLHRRGVPLQFAANTPYINTIPRERQPQYPGDGRI